MSEDKREARERGDEDVSIEEFLWSGMEEHLQRVREGRVAGPPDYKSDDDWMH